MMLVGHIRTLTRGLFQPDFMFVSEHVHGEAFVLRGGFHLNWDLATWWPPAFGAQGAVEFLQRGWVPKTDKAKQIFMRGVAKDLCWARLWCQLKKWFILMLLGLSLTIVPYDSGSGPHWDKNLYVTFASVCGVTCDEVPRLSQSFGKN